MNKKGLILVTGLLVLFALVGCNLGTTTKMQTNTQSSTTINDPTNKTTTTATPVDPTIRIDDERELTAEEYTFFNTVGTDVFGQSIKEADGYREGTQYVGIWYSLWLGQHQYMQSAIYDNTKLMATEEGQAALFDVNGSEISPAEEFHFCAEPLYGYYNMKDPWVLVRHIELLTAAGIDYLSLDCTNAIYYPDVCEILFDLLLKYQEQGYNIPKVMFYTNSNSGTTAKQIYYKFFQTEKYDSIWFAPNGKPMLAGVTENSNGASDQTMWGQKGDPIPEELYDRFEIVESQWPQGTRMAEDSIPWMDWAYPQLVHLNYKAVSVSLAQHDPSRISYSFMGDYSYRGYDHTTGKRYDDYTRGQNFESQWRTVFKYIEKGVDVENVLIAGWNEWMAIKLCGTGYVQFCDNFTDAYSRECEMMNGTMGDNSFMQLCRNIREYKCTDAKHYKYQKMTIDIDDEELTQWSTVKAHYVDYVGECMARDFENAVGSFNYTDDTNRNDITDVKVVHNSKYIYFYVETKEDITKHDGSDKGWMNIFINTNKGNKSFDQFDYVINRMPLVDGTTSIEKSLGGYDWADSGECEYRVYGNVILFKISLESLGLTQDNCYITFKVTDNITNPEDVMSYYKGGDSAPIGRLAYSYGY